VSFCLAGLGARVDDAWLDAVGARLHMPRRMTLGPESRPKRRARATPEASATT
jgi:hypothetical protein